LSQISPLCQSTHAQPDIGIAHQRFSIVDLTSNADQPFSSSDGTICAVFNGEVYNHVELREELASLGCRFRTHSDTEVLVEAYRTWGTSCFARFNGFWAVAIYDHRRRGVILSRDRIGKKPLYWTRQGARFYFASEIKALLAVESIWSTRKVNEAKAFDWLALGLRDTDSSTMFDGVHMFPAAHWAIIDRSFPGRAERFWQLPAPESRLT
jgi:asparagine synthase (glutamine-hydrolysing)